MVHEVTSEAEFNSVLASAGSKAVFVDFFAEWCGPCRAISPYFEELAAAHPESIFVKIDVDKVESTAASGPIRAMPTFMAFKNGKKVGELVGASKPGLSDLITKNA